MTTKASLRQIQAVIAVCEKAPSPRLPRASARRNRAYRSTSSAVEQLLGVRLFDRTATGVTPTPAGLRYYRQCVDAIGMLDRAGEDMRALAGAVTGSCASA